MRRDLIYDTYRVSNYFYRRKIKFIAKCLYFSMRILFSCDIPYTASIGKGTVFPHFALGVVIHAQAVIGENCHINQNVTIGGRSGSKIVPTIGNNVLIGANATIIGPVNIGNNVTIGAGAVVTNSIIDNATAVGVPAKIIKITNL